MSGASAGQSPAVGRYAIAVVPAGRRTPDDLFAPRYAGELTKLVERVIATEAPVHVEVLARRVGAYFGIGRVTERVTAHVRVALAGRGRWGDERDVVWRLDQDPEGTTPVRVAGSDGRRDIGEVPLVELAGAARVVVDRAGPLSGGALVRDTARLLGFARMTDRISERVSAAIALAVARGLVASDGDTITAS
jgi:hypothetical protein